MLIDAIAIFISRGLVGWRWWELKILNKYCQFLFEFVHKRGSLETKFVKFTISSYFFSSV